MEAHQVALRWTCSSAASVTSSERAQTSAATSSSDGARQMTRSMLRNDLRIDSCSGWATTTRGSSLPQAPSSAQAVLVDGSANESSGKHAERAVGRVVGERGAHRRPVRLAVHLDHEAPRLGCERDAAAGELRRADRAGPRPTRAFLPPRLPATTGDHAAALGGLGAGPLSVQLGAHGLVHEMRLDLGAEHGLVEREVASGVALGVEHRCARLGAHLLSSRISTNAFFGPGTAPFTSSRLFSASTLWTVRPTWVARLPPRRPAIF